MRLIVLVGMLTGVAVGAAHAQPVDDLRSAIVAYGSEVGAAAYMFGSCEHYVDRSVADSLAAEFSGANTTAELDSEIAAVFSRMYGRGRKDSAKNNFSAEKCTRLLNEATESVEAARTKMRQILAKRR